MIQNDLNRLKFSFFACMGVRFKKKEKGLAAPKKEKRLRFKGILPFTAS